MAGDDENEQLAALGALRSDDDDSADPDQAHDGDDLALHRSAVEDSESVTKPEETWTDMGTRAIARSAEGLGVMNTLEVLPPFEFSI